VRVPAVLAVLAVQSRRMRPIKGVRPGSDGLELLALNGARLIVRHRGLLASEAENFAHSYRNLGCMVTR
jgi:hypothetical protein